jgi:hypothetical protein
MNEITKGFLLGIMVLALQMVTQTALSQEVSKDKQLCSQINRDYNNQSYAGCRSDYETAFEYTIRFFTPIANVGRPNRCSTL